MGNFLSGVKKILVCTGKLVDEGEMIFKKKKEDT